MLNSMLLIWCSNQNSWQWSSHNISSKILIHSSKFKNLEAGAYNIDNLVWMDLKE